MRGPERAKVRIKAQCVEQRVRVKASSHGGRVRCGGVNLADYVPKRTCYRTIDRTVKYLSAPVWEILWGEELHAEQMRMGFVFQHFWHGQRHDIGGSLQPACLVLAALDRYVPTRGDSQRRQRLFNAGCAPRPHGLPNIRGN